MRVAAVQELLKIKQRNQKNVDKYKRTSQTPIPHADAWKSLWSCLLAVQLHNQAAEVLSLQIRQQMQWIVFLRWGESGKAWPTYSVGQFAVSSAIVVTS